MKKFLFCFIAMLVSIAPAMAQDIETIADNSLYTLDAKGYPGKQLKISVQMKNSRPVQAIGLHFTLPEGLSVPLEDDFYALCDLSTERTTFRKHNLGATFPDKKEYRVAITTNIGAFFSGNSGEVFTIPVDVAENVAYGDYEIKLLQVELSGLEENAEGKKVDWSTPYPFLEYTGKISIVVDPTGIAGITAADSDDIEIYSVNGVKLSSLQPGLNVVKNVKTGEVKTISVK